MSIYSEIIHDLEAIGAKFRIDDLDETLEINLGHGWERIGEATEATINMDLRELGYSAKNSNKPSLRTAKDAWIKYANEMRHNPIKSFFLGLDDCYEPSDGGPYIIEHFSRYFENPDGMFATWLFKWMVGVIAKIFQQQRNPMLVLISEQGSGKSFFARWICPIDRDRFFLESGISPDNKDHRLRLADTLIWELPELGATTRRSDAEALKAFITFRQIKERHPHARYAIQKPCMASFIGSVNFDGAGFLNDPTGSTRFLACEITNIDHSYSVDYQVEQLWAEAYWYYKNVPECYKLTTEQDTKRAEINASFEIASALEEVIIDRFEITGIPEQFMTTQQIKDHLIGWYKIGNETTFLRELGRVLKKLGCQSKREKYQPGKPHARGWLGIKKHPTLDIND
jgi:predicted P-loop ATPase